MGIIKQKTRRFLNGFLEARGFQLTRFSPELSSKCMQSDKMLQLQAVRFIEQMRGPLECLAIREASSMSIEEVLSFSKHLSTSPVQQDSGGGSHNLAILLWYLIRCIEPCEIVESGVFRGFTTWVLRSANSAGRVVAFDVSFAERKWKDPATEYHERDWASVIPISSAMDPRRLAFFDDHQSQWRRIREAAARGFEFVIFDDSFPAWCLHGDADAAFPTVDMLFDDALTDGQEVAWRTECGSFQYRFNAGEAEETRALVSAWVRLPDLQATFGYKPANLVALRLRR